MLYEIFYLQKTCYPTATIVTFIVLLGIGQIKPITSLLLFFKIATSAFSTFLCDFYLIWSAVTSTGWIWTNFWAVQGWYDLEECRIWNKLKRPSAGYFPFTHWQIIGDLGFWMVQLANFHCLSVFWKLWYSLTYISCSLATITSAAPLFMGQLRSAAHLSTDISCSLANRYQLLIGQLISGTH